MHLSHIFPSISNRGIRSYPALYYYVKLMDVEEFSPLFSFKNRSELLYLLVLTRVPAVWSIRA